jgi:hypothetical protein
MRTVAGFFLVYQGNVMIRRVAGLPDEESALMVPT